MPLGIHRSYELQHFTCAKNVWRKTLSMNTLLRHAVHTSHTTSRAGASYMDRIKILALSSCMAKRHAKVQWNPLMG